MPNATITDERLSYRALGVLTYLVSRPDGWETDSDSLADGEKREGRDAVRRALRELEELRYLHRFRLQNTRGHWTTVCYVTDEPAEVEPPEAVAVLERVRADEAEEPTTGFQSSVDRASADRSSDSQALSTKTDPKTDQRSSPVAPGARAPGACPRHRDKPHASCRGCRTNTRAVLDDAKPRRAPWCGSCHPDTRMVEDPVTKDPVRRCSCALPVDNPVENVPLGA